MKKNYFIIFLLLFIVRTHAQSALASSKDISGIWLGKLKVQTMELRIVFHVKTDSAGTMRATMDSPDQGAKGILVDKVTVNQDSILFAINMVGGGFAGAMQAGDSVIIGTWRQGGLALPLDLHRVMEVQESRRSQNPKPPFPYDEEEVSYQNKEAGITLAGTFTKPKSGGSFPALLLITGSGPQNRDEELLGHKPFLILADYLTRRGVAVLRVDDRGIGRSTGKFSGATTQDFAGDVRAGIEYLKTRRDVNAKKIGLLGHSEGGIIAPMVAAESKDVAFIVMMAGTSLPGDQILCLQDSLISLAMGQSTVQVQKDLSVKRAMYALIRNETDTTKLRQGLVTILRESMPTDSTTGGAANKAAVNAALAQLMSPWFRFFLTYDPAPALRKLTCPVLALNGSKDLQVPAQEDLEGMRRAFNASGNKKATAKLLPGLNHLFQKAETGSPSEYAKIDETINPEALQVIGDWIADVTM